MSGKTPIFMLYYALSLSDGPVRKLVSPKPTENVINDKTIKGHSRGRNGATLDIVTVTVLNRQPVFVNNFSPLLLNDRVRAPSAVIQG